MRLPIHTMALVAVLAVGFQTRLTAQIPTPPPAAPTIWSFLGIPQAAQKLNAQLLNRRGNRPGLEAKPNLLHLADPKNLESPVEAIKAAAEVKQAEDLKPQKIKAIKYLASIGCGCYDKEKKITKAMLAAMADCTEDVRLVAIESIEESAAGECCANCSQQNCCSKDISEMLAHIAYERDESGCYVEPSERVREAAISALSVCCPNVGPPYVEELPIEGTLEAPPIEGVEAPTIPDPEPSSDNQEASARRETSSYASHGPNGQTSNRRMGRLPRASRVRSLQASLSSSAGDQRNIAMVVDPDQNIAKVHLTAATRGEHLKVWSATEYGYRFSGRLEVFAVSGDLALVRPLGNLDLSQLSRGTLVARAAD